MRTKTYTMTGLAANATGISAAAATTAGVALTLTGAAASLSPPRFLLFTGSAAISGTFTIVGLDRWGNSITEVVSGVDVTPVRSKGIYSSVTSITPSASDADTTSVGWPVGGQATPWIQIGRGMGTDAVPEALLSVLALTGSPDGDVEITYDMFPRLTDPEINVHQRVLAAAFTPGTPQACKGQGVRFVLTTDNATSCKVDVTRPGIA